jgi:thiol-disulfide isomerase/thioredoxin
MKKTLLGLSLLAIATTFTPANAPITRGQGERAPALVGSVWIGDATAISRAKSFRGHVTIVHFWTFECINCKHNLPHYAAWAKKYDPAQVTIVGVHTPETATEASEANLRREIPRLGINYPVVMDNASVNWNHYHQDEWPAVYVVDQEGRIRGKWLGELQWDGRDGDSEVRQLVDRLIQEGKS